MRGKPPLAPPPTKGENKKQYKIQYKQYKQYKKQNKQQKQKHTNNRYRNIQTTDTETYKQQIQKTKTIQKNNTPFFSPKGGCKRGLPLFL
jgi:hypothetical protein